MAETAPGSDTTSSRPALAPQPSLHDMSDIPTPHGLAKREITKFTDTWNNICVNSMVGDGSKLQAAAICNHAGNVYAYTPDHFLPTIDQVKIIVKAMTNPSVLAVEGIKIGGLKFSYSSCQVSGSTAHAFTGDSVSGKLYIYITKHTILIGLYNGEGKHGQDDALTLMEEIWGWVRMTGF